MKQFSVAELKAKLQANPVVAVTGTGKLRVKVIGVAKYDKPRVYESKTPGRGNRTFTHIGTTNVRSPYQLSKARAAVAKLKAMSDDEVLTVGDLSTPELAAQDKLVNDLLDTMKFNVEQGRVPSAGEVIEVSIGEFTPEGTDETGLSINDYRYVRAEVTTVDLLADETPEAPETPEADEDIAGN